MKKELHPADYRPVVIKDSNSGFAFLTRSTAKTDETFEWEDGKEYPLLTVHISSSSHPFYTGEEKIVDVEGRVDRFKARQAAAVEQREKLASKAKKRSLRKQTDEAEEVQKLGAAAPANKKP